MPSPQVLRRLLPLLRRAVTKDAPPDLRARAAAVKETATAHLERLEAQRAALVAGRALTLAQRMLLYGDDELAMATRRMQLRFEGDEVPKFMENSTVGGGLRGRRGGAAGGRTG